MVRHDNIFAFVSIDLMETKSLEQGEGEGELDSTEGK